MQVVDVQVNQHLNELYADKIGSVRREKAVNLLTKILSNIVAYPNDDKYQSLNHTKISQKFQNLQCVFMIELLLIAGFIIDGDRLKLEQNKCQFVLDKLNDKKQIEEQKLEEQRRQIIEKNKQRLQTKQNQKKKELRNKILKQHQEQMNLAKQGIYNVKATVSDRKGTGNGVNSLEY